MAPDATAKPKRKTQGRLFASESTMTPKMTPTKQSVNPTRITDITYRFFPLRWSRRVVIYPLLRSNVNAHRRAAAIVDQGATLHARDLHPIWWTLCWACAKHSNSTGE